MKEVFCISKKLGQILLSLVVLTVRLGKQTIFPNRKRKGNLLSVLFLFYIGLIEHVRQFEHRNFKMADLLQNKPIRSALMLLGFLLFFLTSFEQPAFFQSSYPQPSKIECACERTSQKCSSSHRIQQRFVSLQLFPASDPALHSHGLPAPSFACNKRYLQTRRLLI